MKKMSGKQTSPSFWISIRQKKCQNLSLRSLRMSNREFVDKMLLSTEFRPCNKTMPLLKEKSLNPTLKLDQLLRTQINSLTLREIVLTKTRVFLEFQLYQNQ